MAESRVEQITKLYDEILMDEAGTKVEFEKDISLLGEHLGLSSEEFYEISKELTNAGIDRVSQDGQITYPDMVVINSFAMLFGMAVYKRFIANREETTDAEKSTSD